MITNKYKTNNIYIIYDRKKTIHLNNIYLIDDRKTIHRNNEDRANSLMLSFNPTVIRVYGSMTINLFTYLIEHVAAIVVSIYHLYSIIDRID